MSYGKDERDIDKQIWKLRIPMWDPANQTHRRLAELGWSESETVAALDLDEKGNFVTLRCLSGVLARTALDVPAAARIG